ncbi:hypothetical protein Tco_0013472 [Tanacetum coccineum]
MVLYHHYRYSRKIKVLPPRTAEEIVARERERKARTALLMALPEDHLAKFHKMMMKRNVGCHQNLDLVEIGRVQEDAKQFIMKLQFEGYSVSNTEGFTKATDGFQSLLSQLEIHGVGCHILCPSTGHEDLEQIDVYDLEELDLKLASGHDLN